MRTPGGSKFADGASRAEPIRAMNALRPRSAAFVPLCVYAERASVGETRPQLVAEWVAARSGRRG